MKTRKRRCVGCGERDRQLEKVRMQVIDLTAKVAELERQLAAATKNSSTSSKPPSSDIVKKPNPSPADADAPRAAGGQPGHERHERTPFPSASITDPHRYTLGCCPDCGGQLRDSTSAPKVIQQVDIPICPLSIAEHSAAAYWCPKCQREQQAALPAEVVQAGLVGPRLTALIGFLKGPCQASFSTIRKFVRDVIGVKISRGQLAKVVQKVSASLREPYDELLALLPHAASLNVDETGHPDRGDRLWAWCFRAALYTLYRISPSRGSDVLLEVLGQEFNGLLGCDYFSAYRKFMKLCTNVRVQFCLAHLIRDVKFLVEHPHAANRRYGRLLLEHLRHLFGIIHRREHYASEANFAKALATVRNALVADAILELPNTREAGNLADRLAVHMDSYFRFITEPGLEPTNNLAEQAIRFVAIHRRLTQGTRGTAGQQWCERIWTVIATCMQQGRSVFEFLYEAVQAHFQQRPAPSLVPSEV
jgi:transposase